MTNAAKRKGSAYERECVAFLKANGHPNAERAYGAGRRDDVGDIDGIEDLTIECKNQKALALAAWMEELATEQANKRTRFGCLFIKRRNRGVADSYVVMSLEQFASLINKTTSQTSKSD